jgi:hypothetical protein
MEFHMTVDEEAVADAQAKGDRIWGIVLAVSIATGLGLVLLASLI